MINNSRRSDDDSDCGIINCTLGVTTVLWHVVAVERAVKEVRWGVSFVHSTDLHFMSLIGSHAALRLRALSLSLQVYKMAREGLRR